jgi:hypothetical protein
MQNRAGMLHKQHREIMFVSPALSTALTTGTLGFARRGNYLMSTGVGMNPSGLIGWGITNMKDIYNKCPPEVKEDIKASTTQWDIQAILTPENFNLLRHFTVYSWSKSAKEIQRDTVAFEYTNLLWIQVVLLDIAIQFFLRGHGASAMILDKPASTNTKTILRLPIPN